MAGIVVGLGVMLWPGWEGALAVGFFVTLASTVAHIVVAHLAPAEKG